MPASFTFDGQLIEEQADRISELRGIADKAGTPARLRVLEWGSGLSTILLAETVALRDTGHLLTIDHNERYQEAVLASIEDKTHVRAFTVDLVGPPSPSSAGVNYGTVPLSLPGPWDLIVIDGRRRLECALVAAMVSDENTIVTLHDYRRARYAPLSKLYNVIDDGPHYRVMRAKEFLRKGP